MMQNYELQLRTLVAPWCSIHHCDMSCLEPSRGQLVENSPSIQGTSAPFRDGWGTSDSSSRNKVRKVGRGLRRDGSIMVWRRFDGQP